MPKEVLRFRQIHLDFHTSELMPDVGAKFSEKQFQDELKRGHVDSITVFSKCHHGLSYHETKVGVRHPNLKTELLQRQIAACKEIDVKTPIYISAGLDEAAIARHPEWSFKSKQGGTFDPLVPGFKALCFNTPYLDYLCAQIEEVVDMFDGGDGIFLDIIAPRHCYCHWCLTDMQARGYDPKNDADVDTFAQEVLNKYMERTTASAKKGNPNRRVFHNSGHIHKGAPQRWKYNSHLELESLPTGGWGYDHFPLTAKYAATTGYDFLGMTGKFHITWGEFGGFKRPEALRYECAAMNAFGSKCSIGDQLHPSGEMNSDTYALVGEAYKEVQAREPWCNSARPVSEIALVSNEALNHSRPGSSHDTPHAEEGAARMLLELQAQFDVVDLEHDLSPYRLVILPDEFTLDGAFAEKIQTYLNKGGKLLLSGQSGHTLDNSAFALDLGLDVAGKSAFSPDYLIAGEAMPTPPVRGRFLIHGGAWDVTPQAGTEVETLAHRANSYFNREWNHFCSHHNTPDAEQSEFPGVVGIKRNGEAAVVYFAHSIFTRYRRYGQPLYRDAVQDAITYLLGDLSVQMDAPSTARAGLTKQDAASRYVLHLLYATPVLRGGQFGGYEEMALNVEVIEGLVPLYDVAVKVQVDETVKSVKLVPEGREIEFAVENGAVSFTVPQVLCGQMVELGY